MVRNTTSLCRCTIARMKKSKISILSFLPSCFYPLSTARHVKSIPVAWLTAYVNGKTYAKRTRFFERRKTNRSNMCYAFECNSPRIFQRAIRSLYALRVPAKYARRQQSQSCVSSGALKVRRLPLLRPSSLFWPCPCSHSIKGLDYLGPGQEIPYLWEFISKWRKHFFRLKFFNKDRDIFE